MYTSLLSQYGRKSIAKLDGNETGQAKESQGLSERETWLVIDYSQFEIFVCRDWSVINNY